MPSRPVIGITLDHKDNSASSGRYESSIAYSRAVLAAGGVPVLLPQEIQAIPHFLSLCQGFVLTGGCDPNMEAFGQVTHPAAKRMDPHRQAFELALLDALRTSPRTPVLGICLGMQMMALHAGGDLHQHLPDVLGEAAARHTGDQKHPVRFEAASHWLDPGATQPADLVVSWHHQAVARPGQAQRVLARSEDGVIEAIEAADRRFFVGVQWHPERGGSGPLNAGLLSKLVQACAPDPATT